jgi:hypothetical protein
MPTVLRNLPFFNHETPIEVHGWRDRVFAWQPVVWVSISHQGLREPSPGMPRFPAIYDSGFTSAFLINREHLRRWAGLHPDHLPTTHGVMRPHGRHVALRAANVWLHPNKRGERDQFSGAPPFLLDIDGGIGVWDETNDYPRFPLLEPRAFFLAGLELCVDHRRLRINARTPRRFWFF